MSPRSRSKTSYTAPMPPEPILRRRRNRSVPRKSPEGATGPTMAGAARLRYRSGGAGNVLRERPLEAQGVHVDRHPGHPKRTSPAADAGAQPGGRLAHRVTRVQAQAEADRVG